MYLKSLTLRGFKSFASSTTLQLEPGITCIVGPNGSGKSNVVDALAWVMGEQGAKSLRGGKMEDVIFAGTSGRPPLGRAEVVLTIDNADGALPIEYAEVTISRTMFRNGGSEYAINGETCRLLDVQELLSDSGIGREMHVIVGQGQLDAVLHATPEERRGFIEEAAGVLKHRKRKEKALRKLDATDANLHRLTDLLGEIRRQLKPLGRQAEVARKAAVVQSEVRDSRARLLADDLVTARSALEQELADESALQERRTAVESELATVRAAEADLERSLSASSPLLADAQETWYHLSGLRERVRGTQGLAAERVRNLSGHPDEEHTGRDPEELEAEAARVQADEARIHSEVDTGRRALETAVEARQRAEHQHVEEERRVAGLARAAADRREGLARLVGQVNALKSRAGAAADEVERLSTARTDALARAGRADHDFTALETRVASLDAGEQGLDAEHEGAQSTLDDIEERLVKCREEAQTAERERASLAARREALEMGLARKDGAAALLEAAGDAAGASDTSGVSGLLGSVAAVLSVRAGYEAAVAGALGSAADAVAVDSADSTGSAVAAIAHLKGEDLGRAGLLLGGTPVDNSHWPALPEGVCYALDVVEAPEALTGALQRLLAKVAVVDDLPAARRLVTEMPDLVAVSRAGDVLAAHFASGGSSSTPSLLEVQAAVDEAVESLAEATRRCERLSVDIAQLQREREQAGSRVGVALAKLHESDAALAAVAEELGQYGSQARSARDEAERLTTSIEQAEQARDRDLAGLAELEARLADAEHAPDEEPDTAERERLADAAKAARAGETEARLALRTAEERARALHGRADSLRASAREERAARAAAVASRERARREAAVAEAVGRGAVVVLQRLDRSLQLAAEARAEVERERSDGERRLSAARAGVRDLAAELGRLTDTVHRDEVARTEQRLRIEQLEQHALDELGLDPEALVADYGPDVPVPPPPLAPGEERAAEPDPVADAVPFVRAEQEKRLRSAERSLALLGKVNPLALEEFSALEERHKFLTEQLEDLRRTRKDLLDIVREVDGRVEQVFTEAFTDVASAFEDVFARLFPGGAGRLVLTEPGDMLRTGIEVEARPPGKKVKRLSLLSGGERSLVAVAFLVALFTARPSPFYILDEVEAALDDTNLGRLLEIYEELRDASQLVVITHQKRTMEVGDALYGVSMRGDGVSAVISQRLRESEPA
ncbi:MAG TPA: chromosome segregation protein SMC [Nocardioidaceae bacterium]|nr:chromosome segregation protein SMC [Nocardioidaceae bacterium]